MAYCRDPRGRTAASFSSRGRKPARVFRDRIELRVSEAAGAGFMPQDPLLGAPSRCSSRHSDSGDHSVFDGNRLPRLKTARFICCAECRCLAPEGALNANPHQFSPAGRRQRYCIVAALARVRRLARRRADHSAVLDVTTQHAILLFLRELVSEFHVCRLLFVTHDFGVVVGTLRYGGASNAGQS